MATENSMSTVARNWDEKIQKVLSAKFVPFKGLFFVSDFTINVICLPKKLPEKLKILYAKVHCRPRPANKYFENLPR